MEESTGGTSAVAEAPASTPSVSESTPASPSSVPADRPTSFAEALTRAAAQTAPATPAPEPPAGDTPPVAAIAQPPQQAFVPDEAAAEASQGPIPFTRHQAALQNARAKTEAEITQRFQQQYAPHVELGQRIQADPIGTVVELIQGLSQHPEHGQSMTAAIARMLGARRGQAQADQEPQADLQAADGTLVYSAERLAEWQQWNTQRLLAEVDSRLQPLQAREQQYVAQQRYREATQAAHDRMSKVLAPYQALPEFREHKPAIATKTQAFIEAGYDAQTALGLAVTTVLREVVMPSRAAQSQQQLVAQAVAKATGSTTTPGQSPSAPAGRPRSFEDAFKRLR